MQRLAAVVVALMVVCTIPASAQSIEGAWRLAEYSSADGPTYSDTESLMIFADGHYSRLFVRAAERRPPLGAESTDADRIAAWAPFVANSGTYSVDGSTLTLRAVVAKQPSNNRTPTTLEFRIEGSTLWLMGDAEGLENTTQRWVRAPSGR